MGRTKKYATEEDRLVARRLLALKYYYAKRVLKDPSEFGKGVSYTPEYHQEYAREYYRRKKNTTNPETESTSVSPS